MGLCHLVLPALPVTLRVLIDMTMCTVRLDGESLNRFDSMTTRRERGGEGITIYQACRVLFLDGMNRHFAK